MQEDEKGIDTIDMLHCSIKAVEEERKVNVLSRRCEVKTIALLQLEKMIR